MISKFGKSMYNQAKLTGLEINHAFQFSFINMRSKINDIKISITGLQQTRANWLDLFYIKQIENKNYKKSFRKFKMSMVYNFPVHGTVHGTQNSKSICEWMNEWMKNPVSFLYIPSCCTLWWWEIQWYLLCVTDLIQLYYLYRCAMVRELPKIFVKIFNKYENKWASWWTWNK